jgi:hypothetical protein
LNQMFGMKSLSLRHIYIKSNYGKRLNRNFSK